MHAFKLLELRHISRILEEHGDIQDFVDLLVKHTVLVRSDLHVLFLLGYVVLHLRDQLIRQRQLHLLFHAHPLAALGVTHLLAAVRLDV